MKIIDRWKKFKHNWIPSTYKEFGAMMVVLTALAFILLSIIFVFSGLILGISWIWGIIL